MSAELERLIHVSLKNAEHYDNTSRRYRAIAHLLRGQALEIEHKDEENKILRQELEEFRVEVVQKGGTPGSRYWKKRAYEAEAKLATIKEAI